MEDNVSRPGNTDGQHYMAEHTVKLILDAVKTITPTTDTPKVSDTIHDTQKTPIHKRHAVITINATDDMATQT